ncbi:SIR2 family protein [Acidovorax sp.]|uniref:SIR2 family protein n=1 Tax=Acidovorax sp. TaxID=1872122 RepID=UPI003D059566
MNNLHSILIGAILINTVHNPDQYIFDFKHIISHGRKKIGVLIGAGAPVSINIGEPGTYKALIPNVEGLTTLIRAGLECEFREAFLAVESQIPNSNIELALSRIRALAEVIGQSKVCGLDAEGFKLLSKKICSLIYDIVSQPLPTGENPFSDTISWINGINRNHPVEIFTTNYDLLFEEAMERVKTPYFDGFSGSKVPFFDPSSISNNDLPKRWVRLWKLHGSIGWSQSTTGEIIRSNADAGSTMVYPSHIKYDQTQSAPFSSLFERLKNFLLEPDTLLICSGFSFADAHISAKLSECMSANPSSALIALQYQNLDKEVYAADLAMRCPNISVYCRDGAIINGIRAPWKLGDPPSKNWEAIRAEYWKDDQFLLGDFKSLARFLAMSGGGKTKAIEALTESTTDE